MFRSCLRILGRCWRIFKIFVYFWVKPVHESSKICPNRPPKKQTNNNNTEIPEMFGKFGAMLADVLRCSVIFGPKTFKHLQTSAKIGPTNANTTKNKHCPQMFANVESILADLNRCLVVFGPQIFKHLQMTKCHKNQQKSAQTIQKQATHLTFRRYLDMLGRCWRFFELDVVIFGPKYLQPSSNIRQNRSKNLISLKGKTNLLKKSRLASPQNRRQGIIFAQIP